VSQCDAVCCSHIENASHQGELCKVCAALTRGEAQVHTYIYMQCVAGCCSVMQCVAVCCSVLQCDAV